MSSDFFTDPADRADPGQGPSPIAIDAALSHCATRQYSQQQQANRRTADTPYTYFTSASIPQ